MQQTDSSPHQDSFEGWQILGKLELTVGVDSSEISTWLIMTLSLLELDADFASTVLKSANETVSRAMQRESAVKSKHIHLTIFVLQNPESNRQDWGFFRIEKVETERDQIIPHHVIEFYLYQETH